MAALADLKCPLCGSKHSLCYPDADFLDGNAVYEYICPTAREVVQISGVSGSCPLDSIILTLPLTPRPALGD